MRFCLLVLFCPHTHPTQTPPPHPHHSDVKLENIFISSDGAVRLGDFGLTLSLKQELAISPVGTVEYMAPEVVALPPVDAVTSGAVRAGDIAACDEKVDVWALGVTLYELLTGHLPFEGPDRGEVKTAIAAGKLRPFPRSLSPGAVAFVSAMLTPDPAERPSAADLLAHPWLAAAGIGTGVARGPTPTYALARFPPVCADPTACTICASIVEGREEGGCGASSRSLSPPVGAGTPPTVDACPASAGARSTLAPRAATSSTASDASSCGSGVLDVLDEVAAPPPPSVVLPPARASRRYPSGALAAARAVAAAGGRPEWPSAGWRGGLSPAPSAPAALLSPPPARAVKSVTASAWPPISAAPACEGWNAAAPPPRYVAERTAWGSLDGGRAPPRAGKPLPRAASAPLGWSPSPSLAKRLRRALRSVLSGSRTTSRAASGVFGGDAAVTAG